MSRSPNLVSLSLVALLSASVGGCFMGDHDRGDHHGWDEQPGGGQQVLTPEEVTIDADATLDAKAGEGIGVMVEYTTGGHWRVFTTCDYNSFANPGQPCAFDVFATVLDAGGSIDNPKGQELQGKDGIEIQSDGTVHLYTENTVRLSGFTFDTAPGAMVELDVYFDAVQDPHVIYWVGKDVLHRGAPTNPLHFVPSEAPIDPTQPATDNPAPGTGDTPAP